MAFARASRAEPPPPGDPAPASARGSSERRESLFAAARRVLESKNIFDLTVDDVVREAGVARGTFYIYFTDKFALVKSLTEQVVEEQVAAMEAAGAQREDRFERLRATTLLALQRWQQHAPVYRAVFQLAMIREDFHALRDRLQVPIRAASAASIAADQQAGLARADIDPVVAAAGINRMYELISMEWFAWASAPYEGATLESVAASLARIWYHALYPGDLR